MNQEIEEIKKILLKYNPTIKEKLDEGLVESKSIYDLEEFIDESVKITDLDIMDIVLIVDELRKLEKKKFKMLNESEEDQQSLNHKKTG